MTMDESIRPEGVSIDSGPMLPFILQVETSVAATTLAVW